ncbi:MAG TPA: hypothetical protein VHG88_10140 [Burkholderiales bacterium]|nr:hypothetical protein [Burkholderiales bacterium]
MSDVLQAVEAARLLGRWTLIAERHAGGCSCCPGLGDVAMDELEGRVLAWLRERHAPLRERGSLSALLRECIERKTTVDPSLFGDLAEALDHLERVQAGLG